MKYFRGISVLLTMVLLASCIKHEVIPPPKKVLNLPASFYCSKDGQTYELIKDLEGYYCYSSQAKAILPTPQLSEVIYYSALKSDNKMDYIQIGLGQLLYDANDHIDPTLDEFKTFFNANSNPVFKDNAVGGVEIIYRDASGRVWKSSETSTSPQSFTIESMQQSSDESGDYMKFTAKFNAWLYEFDPVAGTIIDTLVMQNAIYEGFFKRQNN